MESDTFFDYRTPPQFVVISDRPQHDTPDALEIELTPHWDKQTLSGYQLQTTGEVEFGIRVPPELARDDLGSKLSIRIVGRDFIFALHHPHSKWKDASKLVSQGSLQFFKPSTSGGKSASSSTKQGVTTILEHSCAYVDAAGVRCKKPHAMATNH